MTYFLKKLGHQELGSISTSNKPARGRYIYISKDSNVLEFFPSLSKEVKNDKAIMKIIPLYQKEKNILECTFVYNNDIFHNSHAKKGRNEYRFYLKKLLEDNLTPLQVNDILVMKDTLLWLPNETGGIEEVKTYFLDLIKPSETEYYEFCLNLININSSPKNDTTALYQGYIPFFETKKNQVKKSSDKHSTEKENILALFSTCCVTGTVISAMGCNNLDLYLINPKSNINLNENTLVFSKDIGWAFNNGLFTLSDDLFIQVHPDVDNSLLTMYNGKKIFLPSSQNFRPHRSSLKYHRENVFGSFKNRS